MGLGFMPTTRIGVLVDDVRPWVFSFEDSGIAGVRRFGVIGVVCDRSGGVSLRDRGLLVPSLSFLDPMGE